MTDQHSYTLDLMWTGKTDDPRTYDRSYILSANEKTEIAGSADPSSRGDPKKWNPEELLLASLASCHMLWYLFLCASSKIVVLEYQDHPTGILNINPTGKSAFVGATLTPRIVIADPNRIEDAIALQQQAHAKCYIINSVNFEVKINAQVKANKS